MPFFDAMKMIDYYRRLLLETTFGHADSPASSFAIKLIGISGGFTSEWCTRQSFT